MSQVVSGSPQSLLVMSTSNKQTNKQAQCRPTLLISDNIKGVGATETVTAQSHHNCVSSSATAQGVAFGRCESKGLHSVPHRTDRMHHRYCLTTLNECDESQVELYHSVFFLFITVFFCCSFASSYDCHRSDFYFRQQSIIIFSI
jgi:hypothetical protein